MKCIDFEIYMSEYYDDMMNESQRQEFEGHMNSCEDCRVKYENMKNILEEVNEIPEIELPEGFHEELMDKLKKEDKKGSKVINIDFKRFSKNKKGMLIAASLMLLFASSRMFDLDDMVEESMDYSAKSERSTEFAADMAPMEASPNMAVRSGNKAGGAQLSVASNQAVDEAKIIRSGYINIEVTDLPKSFDEVILRTRDFSGFVERSNMMSESKNANISVRIPKERFDDYIAVVEKLGQVKEKNISEVNVTQSYIDMDSRLNNLKSQEERIRQILMKAEKIQEIIEIERELSRVRSEIESLTRNLRNIDNQVSYSSLNINLSVDRNPFWDDIKYEFRYSFNSAIRNVIGLIRYIPYALIAWFGYLAYKNKRQ